MLNVNGKTHTSAQMEDTNNTSQSEIKKKSSSQTKPTGHSSLLSKLKLPFKIKNLSENNKIPKKETQKTQKTKNTEPFFDTPINFVRASNSTIKSKKETPIKVATMLFEQELKDIKIDNPTVNPWGNRIYQIYKKHIEEIKINDYFKILKEKKEIVIDQKSWDSDEYTMYRKEIEARGINLYISAGRHLYNPRYSDKTIIRNSPNRLFFSIKNDKTQTTIPIKVTIAPIDFSKKTIPPAKNTSSQELGTPSSKSKYETDINTLSDEEFEKKMDNYISDDITKIYE
ncbi:hypothetical protein [Mycoavidus sp. B2-EB]|uniref:hypothetical protein n=1 Tax=Mycoavidus sp. B2-EB TaxID=2651972 RepID=UPI0016252BCD|nr:hypothetical protein [Mycoavidus sp. B2-EB]BBO59478.1 hypothetical protein MPB2EB_0597 [Mycoavidus sp. B2-EB]